jgi:threonine dehydratase
VFTASLAAGRITKVTVLPSLADGLTGNMEPDSRTFELVRALVNRVAVVAEDPLARAMRELIRRERLIVEGAGAAGVAAVLAGGLDLSGRRVGIVLTGRNVDPDVVARVLN